MAPGMAHVPIPLFECARLSRKSRLRKSADAQAEDAEEAASKVLWLRCLREQIVDRWMLHPRHRGDVQLVEPIAAEHHARDVAHRHADAPVDGAVRSVA